MIALMQVRNSWRIWVTTSHESTMAVDSLAPGRFKVNFRWVIFKLILVVNDWGMSCETALIWMSLDHIYGELTLVQTMAWCRQATSHYLSQCWPRSLSPYGVTRPQWFNITTTKQSTTKPIAHIMGLTICAIMFQAALLLHLPRRSHERSLWYISVWPAKAYLNATKIMIHTCRHWRIRIPRRRQGYYIRHVFLRRPYA